MNASRPILVPTDLSQFAERALNFALRLARPIGAPVHLLHVLDLYRTELPESFEDTPATGSLWEQMEAAAADELGRLAEVYSREDNLSIEQRRRAAVVPAILDTVRARQAQLIVMGTHGRRGVRRFLLGSVAAEILREAPCDVVVVPPAASAERDLKHILVPVDLSPVSRPILERAKELAAAFGAQVDLLYVFEEPSIPVLWPAHGVVRDLVPDMKRRAEEEVERLRTEAGGPEVPVDVHVKPGKAAAGILDFARTRGSDLIVMGSHGHTGLNRFLLGSVTERVLPQAPCPVYVHRAATQEQASQSADTSETVVWG